ncbi:MAG TPA: flavin reductase family protein [Pseudonocardiaceae bacterium]|nr:flavin reductase family protein [Pseudonocardiaceae bacterium]
MLWCLRGTSTSRVAFTSAPRFVINVPSAGQEHLARRFAGHDDRFAGTPLVAEPDVDHPPELTGTAAILQLT